MYVFGRFIYMDIVVCRVHPSNHYHYMASQPKYHWTIAPTHLLTALVYRAARRYTYWCAVYSTSPLNRLRLDRWAVCSTKCLSLAPFLSLTSVPSLFYLQEGMSSMMRSTVGLSRPRHTENWNFRGQPRKTVDRLFHAICYVDYATSVPPQPVPNAIHVHDGASRGDEHFFHLRKTMKVWGHRSRIYLYIVCGGKNLWLLRVSIAS